MLTTRRFSLSTNLRHRWLGLASVAILSGCASSSQMPDNALEVAPENKALFAHRYTESLPSVGWNRLEYIRELTAQGKGKEAISLLEPMVASNDMGSTGLNAAGSNGSPEAAYEMGRIYSDGLGNIPRDPARAAQYFRMAVPYDYSGLDNASLYLGRLYRVGDGVEKNPTLAWNLFQQAIEHDGNPSARVELAQMQLAGEGVPQDIAAARSQLEQAADLEEEPRALLMLAENHAAGGQFEESPAQSRGYAERYVQAMSPRANAGDVGAMLNLARLHAADGLLPNPVRQEKWLTQAADSGDPEAMAAAGRFSIEHADPDRGIDLLTRAAEAGNADAAYWLGDAYLGQGEVQADPEKAEQWLSRAAQQEHLDAIRTLGSAYIDGDTLPQNISQGVQLLERAAQQQDTYAMAQLGGMYLEGEQVQRRPGVGIDYLQQASDQGYPYATARLGEAYLSGDAVPADPVRAIGLLKRAAQAEQSGAARILGVAYLDEQGVEFDPAEAKRWLELAIEQDSTDTTSRTRLGQALLENRVPGAPGRGIELLEESANMDDAYAMVVLGRAYRNGTGVAPDLRRSTQWLQRADRLGHPSAREALARTYRASGERGDIDALTRAAQMGEVPAMSDLGQMYLHGNGVRVDYAQAQRWLTQAANAGDMAAKADLGEMLLKGLGGSSNPQRGADLLAQAANAGRAYAGVTLGEAYLNGTGVPVNAERGVQYLEQAARQGNDNAQRLLGMSYLEGNGVTQDPDQAIDWLTQAADNGNVSAKSTLGAAYLEGENGVAQDVSKGEQLLTSAADAGHAGAQAALGRAYLSGDILPANASRGTDLLVRAARQGHQSARVSLAQAYLQTKGVEFVDRQQAIAWLNNVMESDDSDSIETLKDLLEDPEVAASIENGPST